jgi:hypothetical protein
MLEPDSKYSRYISSNGLGRMSQKSKDIARTVLMSPKVSYQDVADRYEVTRQRVGAISRRLGIGRTPARRSDRRKEDVG